MLQLEFLDDFSVRSAPGPYVYLSNIEHSVSGAIEVGKLPTGTNPIVGPFTMVVPEGVSINDYKYVVVYCKPFSIPFGTAELN